MINQHPFKILTYSAKNLWLLVFPLLRGLAAIRYNIGEFYSWLQGAWFDILIITVILATGYIRWKFSFFNIENKEIIYCSGIFIRTKTCIPYSKISTITVDRKLFYRFIQAANITIDTSAGMLSKSDMKILIRYSDFHVMEEKISIMNSKKGIKYSYKPEWKMIMFFSFLFSSSFSGAVYIATVFFQSSKIIEGIINKKLTDTFSEVTNEASHKLALGIPPLILGIAILVIASWGISFIRNILRYIRFRIEKDSYSVKINMGILRRHVYFLVLKKINYVDLRQNLIMKIFSVMSVNINCSGYGNDRSELPVFVPIMKKNQVSNTLKIFTQDIKIYNAGLKPSMKMMFRYIWIPLFLLISILSSSIAITDFYPYSSRIVRFSVAIVIIPIIWLLIIKTISLFTTYVSFTDNQICLCCCRIYSFHTILASSDKIAKIHIRQSLFQRFSKTCDVIIFLNSEVSKRHIVKGISKDAAEHLFDYYL